MRATTLDESSPRMANLLADVEKMYIAQFLKSKGYTVEQVAGLPAEEARALREEACLYASLKLAELETGAALVGTLHLDDSLTTNPRVEESAIKQQPAPEG